MLFFRQLTEDDLPSFTELQDADNEIVTTLGPNKELDSVAQLVKNTNTEAPVTVAGASIKPILQLKPVPEIVKPAAPTTRRPHTFIRFRKYAMLLLLISIFFHSQEARGCEGAGVR